MPWATSDGVELYYERDGVDPSDGETVVLLQTAGAGRWQWRPVREGLAAEFDVIAPDTRGTGRSEDGLSRVVRALPRRLAGPLVRRAFAPSLDDLAGDLETVLDDAGVRSAHLVGAGLGATLALRYALEYTRAASLTLCGATHGGVDAVPIPPDVRAQLLETPRGRTRRRQLRERQRPAFSEAFTNRNPHLIDQLLEWRLEQDAADLAALAQLTAFENADLADSLWSVRCPTLVLHGGDDRIVPAANGRLLAEKLPDARLEVRTDGSHLFFFEDADWTLERLREHLGARVAP
ncbi:alpha/beta fold hydrolase [Natronobiforma cellulositropha]|uniref:alpha/beta fold hydrolase n=1 Tax=Natronobiforma cellulositropha TaxID=1679076 RepID=UPI0021D5D4CC|nr:alpha/beta hydrolase [Natronobiforma cellulositropha]